MIVKREPQPQPKNYRKIPLGKGFFAIVDTDDYEWLRRWRWFAKRSNSGWYAVRKRRVRGREQLVRMHREITGCPRDKVVHHLNHRTLDNRKCNLVNLYPYEHQLAEKTW